MTAILKQLFFHPPREPVKCALKLLSEMTMLSRAMKNSWSIYKFPVVLMQILEQLIPLVCRLLMMMVRKVLNIIILCMGP